MSGADVTVPVAVERVLELGVFEGMSLLTSSGELESEAVLGDFTGDLPQPEARLCLTVVTGVLGVTGVVAAGSISLVSDEAVLLLVRSCNCSCCFFIVFLFLQAKRNSALLKINLHQCFEGVEIFFYKDNKLNRKED